jgi:RNA polymerase sigma factor (sigma-70 family)
MCYLEIHIGTLSRYDELSLDEDELSLDEVEYDGSVKSVLTLDSPFSESKNYVQLVKRAKRKDAIAFEMLWQDYGPYLCAFLTHRVGNEEDACELMQEAFLKAWENLPTLKEECYFKTWLYRIAINETNRFLEKAKHRNWLSWEKYELLAEVKKSSITIEEWVAEKDLVHAALKCVSPTYRDCLLLQILGEFRQSEISELLGIPAKNVSTNIKRGLVQLTKAYYSLRSEIDTSETKKGE